MGLALTSDVNIRCANSADQLDLFALYTALSGAENLGSVEQIEQILAHSGTCIWVAQYHGQLVSMATLHLLPNVTNQGRPYALIENVVTLPSYQRRGFGRAVMRAAIDAAWDANAYKVMLMTGRTAGAKGFYESLGFDSSEKWPMTLRRTPVRS